MGQFKFSLQMVLELREGKVKDIERKIEETTGQRDKLRALLLQERDHYFTDRNDFNGAVKKAEIHKLPVFESSMELRKQRMLRILENIRELEADIDVLSRALIQSKKDLKTIENLREKKRVDYVKTEEMKDRKFLDEQATLRFLRREAYEKREE